MSIRLKSGIAAVSLAVILAAGTAQGRQCDPTYWAELKRAEAHPDEGNNRDLAAFLRALTPETVGALNGRGDLCSVYTSYGVDSVKEVDEETLAPPTFGSTSDRIRLVTLASTAATYNEQTKKYEASVQTPPLMQGRWPECDWCSGGGSLSVRSAVMEKIKNGSVRFGDFADPNRSPNIAAPDGKPDYEYSHRNDTYLGVINTQVEYWASELDIPAAVLEAAYNSQMQANRAAIRNVKIFDYIESLAVMIGSVILWLWYRRTIKSGGFGYKIVQFKELRHFNNPVWIGGRRWVFAEREWRRVSRTNGKAVLWDPTPRQDRISDDLHGQINRSRAVWWIGAIFVVAALLLAFNHANPHDPAEEDSRTGFAVAGFGVIAALVLIASERLYRSGWQAMPGAMVLDPEPDAPKSPEDQQPQGASADESTI